MSTPTIRKITASDPLAASADVVAENVAKLKALFPELITEGEKGASVNIDVLKQLVGDQTLTDAEEKFGLNWHGKRRARQLALTPSTGTLRPCPEESVDWDTTQNVFIEGDNLEVLKLLQKTYAGRVKMIYIDPPYNTGNDFIYPDNFGDSIRRYHELTGQSLGGVQASSNTESGGRFHTNWLNMMYPRIRIARDLLAPDGVGFISLDGNEVAHCRVMLSELLGEENFVSTIVWVSNLKGRQIGDGGPVGTHEYLLCFSRSAANIQQFRGSGREFRELMPSVYKGAGYEVEQDAKGAYVVKNELYNTNSKFNEKTAPTMVFRIHHNFTTGETRVTDIDDPKTFDGFTVIMPHKNARPDVSYHAWRWSRTKVVEESDDLKFEKYGSTARVYTKIRDVDGMALKDIVIGPSTVSGQEDLEALDLARTFDTVKPVDLLRLLISSCTGKDALVLDFFAGSGSTGHAVMAQNATDDGKRRFLLVQLPLALDPDAETSKEASKVCRSLGKPANIAEVSKERLRRAGKAVSKTAPMFRGDTGFRVFKLDGSNIREWDVKPGHLATAIAEHEDHLLPERGEQDMLYELLLKRGLDLCVPIDTKTIAGKKVHSVGAGSLIACLDPKITRDDGEALALGIAAWHKELNPAGETAVVFRDDAFADDVVKTNVAAILEQHGLKNVRSL